MTTSISQTLYGETPIPRQVLAKNASTRIRYIEIFSHTFYYFMGEEYRSFY